MKELLIISIILILLILYRNKEKFIVNNKCEFIPWGDTHRGCIDRCRIDRQLWGEEACTLSKCAQLCNDCENVKTCKWKNRAPLLKNPNIVPIKTKPLIIRGIEGSKECLIEWIHNIDDTDDTTDTTDNDNISYILKYFVSSKPYKGIKIVNISEPSEHLNTQKINNLKNNFEYTFMLLKIKNGEIINKSNIIVLLPDEKYKLKSYSV